MIVDLAQILDLIRQHGQAVYGFVFAYAASHSLLLALFSGYAAKMGALDWGTLVLVCWVGSFTGDAVRFWIGRRFGIDWLSSFPRVQAGVRKAARVVDRHPWMPLVHRYPHGIRGVGGFAFGISTMSWPLFAVLNFVSAGIWAVLVVSVGYAFGHLSEKTLSDAASGVSFAALVIFLGLAWVLSNKLDRAVERN